MALVLDPIETVKVKAAEVAIKNAMTKGLVGTFPVEGLAPPAMTLADYTPAASPLVAQSANMAIAAGVIRALRASPMPLPVYLMATLPDATKWPYCLIGVTNGAAGSPCVAFSNGANWLRLDNLAAVSAS